MARLIQDPCFNILYRIQGNSERQIARNLSLKPPGYVGGLIYFVPQILSDLGLLFGKSAASADILRLVGRALNRFAFCDDENTPTVEPML
ncbi:hypothetical protein Trydic_g6024 [Trypoxylus dichotomus]